MGEQRNYASTLLEIMKKTLWAITLHVVITITHRES